MSDQEKLSLLENIMDLEPGELTPEMILEEMEEWDSLSKLALTLEVKNRYQKNLDIETIQSFTVIRDILDYLD